MIRSRSAPRQTPACRGGAAALLATALVAVAPTAGRAIEQPGAAVVRWNDRTAGRRHIDAG
jgi:hypothetical protein